MLYPDPQTAQLLVRQRQAEYEHEKTLKRLARPYLERRRQQQRQRLRRLGITLARYATRSRARGISEERPATAGTVADIATVALDPTNGAARMKRNSGEDADAVSTWEASALESPTTDGRTGGDLKIM